jgi:hypothetical protein
MLQGVWHVFPSDARASAPDGDDSTISNAPLGFDLKASKLGMATELQDASPTLQVTTARARLLAAKWVRTVARNISITYPATRPMTALLHINCRFCGKGVRQPLAVLWIPSLLRRSYWPAAASGKPQKGKPALA